MAEAEFRQKDIAAAKKQQEDAVKEEIIKAAPKPTAATEAVAKENFGFPSANHGIAYNQNH